MKPLLETQDPTFKPEHLSMWSESLPSEQTQATHGHQLVSCDEKIDELTVNQCRLQFEADSLSLARDAAQLARLFGEESKTERAGRLAKVCHLRQENQIGSNLVQKHMEKACRFRCGSIGDLQVELGKAMGG